MGALPASVAAVLRMEFPVLDILFVLGVIGLFAAFGLLGKAVERL